MILLNLKMYTKLSYVRYLMFSTLTKKLSNMRISLVYDNVMVALCYCLEHFQRAHGDLITLGYPKDYVLRSIPWLLRWIPVLQSCLDPAKEEEDRRGCSFSQKYDTCSEKRANWTCCAMNRKDEDEQVFGRKFGIGALRKALALAPCPCPLPLPQVP